MEGSTYIKVALIATLIFAGSSVICSIIMENLTKQGKDKGIRFYVIMIFNMLSIALFFFIPTWGSQIAQNAGINLNIPFDKGMAVAWVVAIVITIPAVLLFLIASMVAEAEEEEEEQQQLTLPV